MSKRAEWGFPETLTAAQAGDALAFEQLYRALNRRVASFGKARRASDPEGLVNDVFLRVFSSIGDFSGTEAQFNGWVFRITRNLLADAGRQRARRVHEVAESTATSVASPEQTPDEVTVSNLGAEELIRHLDVLTTEQRDVVLLRVVADQTIEVVSASLGKSVGAVKAMQHRALRSLAREISREAVSP